MLAMVFDCETTGLCKHFACPYILQPEIIQWYGVIVDLDSGEQGQVINTFVRPKKWPRSVEVFKETRSKIKDRQLEHAPYFATVATAVRRLIEGAEAVVAHNVAFDIQMTDVEFGRIGGKVYWPRSICTMEQTTHLAGRRMTLSRLYEHLFGEKFGEAHLADRDTQALVRIAVELWQRGVIS